jgi:uncharacterized protein (UPF0332 family)
MSRRFLQHAHSELNRGHRLQASEKVWGAVAHALKAIGEQRGWSHDNHQNIKDIGDHLANEFDRDDFHGLIVEADAMHQNFYKNEYERDHIRSALRRAETFVAALDQIREEPPQPFTITEPADQRRLGRLLQIAKKDFQRMLPIGARDPHGFSINPQDGDGESGLNPAVPLSPSSGPSPTIQEPMPTYSPSGSTNELTAAGAPVATPPASRPRGCRLEPPKTGANPTENEWSPMPLGVLRGMPRAIQPKAKRRG